jgi:hypothetical protein
MARYIIDGHDEWDSMHQFLVLGWDGEELTVRTVAMIDPAIDPPEYPKLMFRMAAEDYQNHKYEAAYAFALQIEGHGVEMPAKDASEEEKAAFESDRLGRNFHSRPDAKEAVFVWLIDIHGRMWSVTKYRGREDEIEELFLPPGSNKVGGQMVRALQAIASATGTMGYGLRPEAARGGHTH